MIDYTVCTTTSELNGILQLQQANLAQNLTLPEIKSGGFVTVHHTFAQLKKMNDRAPHVIAKEGDRVIAYLLAMTASSSADIPVLRPMFESFRQLMYKDRFISDQNYLVVGQVCVDKDYRGQGIFGASYNFYRHRYCNKFDFAITEIAASNTRSLAAHRRTGFVPLHHYKAPGQTEWIIVVWDWR